MGQAGPMRVSLAAFAGTTGKDVLGVGFLSHRMEAQRCQWPLGETPPKMKSTQERGVRGREIHISEIV